MALKMSEIIARDISSEFTEYKALGLQFTYHRRLNRIVLDDGTGRVYSTAESKNEAKQAILRYCKNGTFSKD
jgi:hypothetical protein